MTRIIYRHTVATRILHWVNALCVFILLMSGLQIFNAHPRLYWGQYGAKSGHAVLQIYAENSQDGAVGTLAVGCAELRTRGVLGVCGGEYGKSMGGAFASVVRLPGW